MSPGKHAKPARKHKPKKTVKITIVKKILGKTPEKHEFYLRDGRKLETVFELIDELETMTEDTFKEYVTDAENHFANWMEHVFDEKSLAHEMRRIKNKAETQRALLKHLVKTLIQDRKK